MRIPVYESRLVRRGSIRSPSSIRTSSELYELVKSKFKDLDREHFCVLYFDSGLKPIGFKLESIGGSSQCVVDLRLLLKSALIANASSIALIHNHPSGELKPSREDQLLTEAVFKGCSFVGIKLIDHLIVSEVSYYSFSDEDSSFRRSFSDSREPSK